MSNNYSYVVYVIIIKSIDCFDVLFLYDVYSIRLLRTVVKLCALKFPNFLLNICEFQNNRMFRVMLYYRTSLDSTIKSTYFNIRIASGYFELYDSAVASS